MALSGTAVPEVIAGRIPILDITDYLRGKPRALETLAEQLAWALENVGFYFLKAPPGEAFNGTLPRLMEMNRQVHRLPRAKLEGIGVAKDRQGLGYSFGQEGLPEEGDEDYQAVRSRVQTGKGRAYDQQAYVSQGSFRTLSLTNGHGRRFVDQGHICPEESDVPGFRETAATYFAEMSQTIGTVLLPVYAKALRMPEEEGASSFREAFFQEPGQILNLNYYPPRPVEKQDWNGINSHADVSFLTVVAQDGLPGLLIMLPDGEWVPVPPVPEHSVLVNTGEFLRRFTNNRWRNPVHKVIPPADAHRHSIAFFFNMDKRVPVAPFPQFCTPEAPALYDPVTFVSFYGSGETPFTVGAREMEKRRGKASTAPPGFAERVSPMTPSNSAKL